MYGHMTVPHIYNTNGDKKTMPKVGEVIGAHLTPDGHGHTPMGCPGVRLEALQKFTVCLRLFRPGIGSMHVRPN